MKSARKHHKARRILTIVYLMVKNPSNVFSAHELSAHLKYPLRAVQRDLSDIVEWFPAIKRKKIGSRHIYYTSKV